MSVVQAGYVLVCTAVDALGACTAQAWMLPPSGIPPMTMEDSLWLFSQSTVVLVYAWGWRQLGRFIRS